MSLLTRCLTGVRGYAYNDPPIERSYPPISPADTICVAADGSIQSIHGEGLSFQDQEIYRVRLQALPGHKIQRTRDGKAVLQQQAVRGCTTACAAMLLADHGKAVDWKALRTRNLGTNESMIREIRAGGLREKITKVTSMRELSSAIKQNGPAIISIENGIGDHVVILDAIYRDLKRATIRDPYHGWQVEITSDALKKALSGHTRTHFQATEIIQIQI